VSKFGVMPLRIWPPARPSRVRWFPVMLSSVVAIGSLLLEGNALESSRISSMSSLVCKKFPRVLSPAAATMVVVKSTGTGMRMVLASGSRANYRWCSSFGAPGGQPACSAAAPPNLLAEGRPNFFLPAWVLDGRQCYSSSMFTACCGEELVGPSGGVPGAGEFGVVREWLGPDCVPPRIFRVLFAYSRDCFVIFTLLCCVPCCSCLYCIAISNKV
jgi:hypothetical protein